MNILNYLSQLKSTGNCSVVSEKWCPSLRIYIFLFNKYFEMNNCMQIQNIFNNKMQFNSNPYDL